MNSPSLLRGLTGHLHDPVQEHRGQHNQEDIREPAQVTKGLRNPARDRKERVDGHCQQQEPAHKVPNALPRCIGLSLAHGSLHLCWHLPFATPATRALAEHRTNGDVSKCAGTMSAHSFKILSRASFPSTSSTATAPRAHTCRHAPPAWYFSIQGQSNWRVPANSEGRSGVETTRNNMTL